MYGHSMYNYYSRQKEKALRKRKKNSYLMHQPSIPTQEPCIREDLSPQWKLPQQFHVQVNMYWDNAQQRIL